MRKSSDFGGLYRFYLVYSRRNYASRTFQNGDVVVLRPVNDPKSTSLSTLDPNRTYQTPNGSIKATDILQKPVHGLIVNTKKGVSYRVSEPSLAEYVTLTKRLVTPIYQDHANLIVNLLDLHPLDASQSHDERIEILEAGTGHGSLTLCLARAIHGSNGSSSDESNLQSWRENRNAVLHTVEISPAHSTHAQKIVQGFRHGLYARNVDFHIGDLSSFFQEMKSQPNYATRDHFLSHVVLDMPSSNEQLDLVSKHMQNDAKLLVFNPSITQIADCVQTIHQRKLPFRLERVVELAGSFSGGREWDVRIARIKKPNATPQVKRSWLEALFGFLSKSRTGTESQKYAMVCRPMAGDRIVVGGFVGLWTRIGN